MCHHLPLVISGSVRVYKIGESGREITLYHLEQGDSCIMTASCIISQKVFPAFAVTETEVEAIIVPAHSLREWIKHNPVWQEYIFGLLAQRLDNVIEVVEEVAFRRLDCRIANYLVHNVDPTLQTLTITHEACTNSDRLWANLPWFRGLQRFYFGNWASYCLAYSLNNCGIGQLSTL